MTLATKFQEIDDHALAVILAQHPRCDDPHLEGRCPDCDASYLSDMTLDEVERLYRDGRVGQVAWEAFRWAWEEARVRTWPDVMRDRWDEYRTDPHPDALNYGLVILAHMIHSG